MIFGVAICLRERKHVSSVPGGGSGTWSSLCSGVFRVLSLLTDKVWLSLTTFQVSFDHPETKRGPQESCEMMKGSW